MKVNKHPFIPRLPIPANIPFLYQILMKWDNLYLKEKINIWQKKILYLLNLIAKPSCLKKSILILINRMFLKHNKIIKMKMKI